MTYIIRLKDGSWQRYESRHSNWDAAVREIYSHFPETEYIEQPQTPSMHIKYKKLHPKACAPYKAHPTDAGYDLTATSREIDEYGNVVYGTGLAFEIPEGYVGLLFPRSSVCEKNLVPANAVGVIDSHYRGEVTLKFRPVKGYKSFAKYLVNHGIMGSDNVGALYGIGDRFAQLIIMPLPEIVFQEADTLSETDRGTGGYGSSGK